MEAPQSNSEEFRGVIDDLTIQNKRLRKKLRQYKTLHCSHLQDEKLFEVRFHGLAPHRKRKLEEILRSFASNIEESLDTSVFNIDTLKASTPALTNHKPASSSTSYSKGSKPIDSAYASMSGKAISSQKPLQDSQHTQAQSKLRQQNVKSHLHDTPETLVPHNSFAMSEGAKSKLVVRRLEQIFTGRRITRRRSRYEKPPDFSQSAAQSDITRLEAQGLKFPQSRAGVRQPRVLPKGAELQLGSLSEANLAVQQSQQRVESHEKRLQKEGTREARIFLGCVESQIDSSSETNLTGQQSRLSTDEEGSVSRGQRASRGATPDQRPTRPIDLDLQRAQPPSANIEYIRHLGLASPTATADVTSDPDDGWVFLNLLTSMAQLHTLNVTPEFIRHAIADVSSKFELSTDGTKVRWMGGTDGTKINSDSDESDETGNWKFADSGTLFNDGRSLTEIAGRRGLEDDQETNNNLPIATIDLATAVENGGKRRPMYLEQPADIDNFQYKPLFFHGTASEDEDALTYTTNSLSSFDPLENGTGLHSGSHGIRESEARPRKQTRRNGPIIFYNKAEFCTDLSGDLNDVMCDEAAYSRCTEEPIGFLSSANRQNLSESESVYVSDGEGVMDSLDLDHGDESPTRSAMDLEDLKSSISDVSATSPIPMEASGLGGVQPEDNFMVKVRIRYWKGEGRISRTPCAFSSSDNKGPRLFGRMHRGIANRLREARDIPRSQPIQGPIKSEIISTARTDMRPSSLPPPSYICLPFSSSESDDGDDEGDDEDDDASIERRSEKTPSLAKSSVKDPTDSKPTKFSLGSSSDEDQESSYLSTSSEADDSSSIDFLANARALDPDTIAAQEREFEINSVQQVTPTGATAVRSGEPLISGVAAKADSDVDSMIVDGYVEDD